MKNLLVNLVIFSLFISGCATTNTIEIIDESSEGLLSYMDFSSVDKTKEGFDLNTFEQDKSDCAITASTADTDGNDLANIGVVSVGAAVGAASASTAAAAAVAGPLAILSVGIVYGLGKIANRRNAAPIKASILSSCLNEMGYEVSIKQK